MRTFVKSIHPWDIAHNVMIKLTYDDKNVSFRNYETKLHIDCTYKTIINNKRSRFFCVGQLQLYARVQNLLQYLDIGLIGILVCSTSKILYSGNAY